MLKLNYYKNKKVLITGHSGFKGAWLSLALKTLGAKIYGVSKEIKTNQGKATQTKANQGKATQIKANESKSDEI